MSPPPWESAHSFPGNLQVFEYIRRDEEGNVDSIQTAVDHVDLDVKEGDFVVILGHNGSGIPVHRFLHIVGDKNHSDSLFPV